MDRRTFLASVGTVGASAAAAGGGWAAWQSGERASRAKGLAAAAGASPLASRGPKAGGMVDGLVLGFLVGSSWLMEDEASGRQWDASANLARWTPWDPAKAVPGYHPAASVALGSLQAGAGMLRSLEVVAHFAIEGAPHFAAFDAWKYAAPTPVRPSYATAPLAFDALLDDRVALEVNYSIVRSTLAPQFADSGSVYVPLGGRDGPGVGLYVLAGPSRLTGMPPDFADYHFSGDLRSPLSRDSGGGPDFDFVTLALGPQRA
jgi:hypothetical protein